MLHRCRPAGYRLVAAAVTVAAGLTLLGAPAGAVPDPVDPKAPPSPSAERPADGNCSTGLYGVSTANRITARSLDDGRVRNNAVVPRSLPFKVTSMGYGDSGGDEQGFFFEILSQSADKKLRLTTVRYKWSIRNSRWTARPLANGAFRHRLLTGSLDNYFAVDPQGVLRRWHLLRNDRGQRYLGGGTAVRRGLGGLKTLTHYGTFRRKGGNLAIMFGTTRTGALVQIRVVDRNPKRVDEPVGGVRLVRLRNTGFGKYDTATVGTCNDAYNQAAITFIDRDADRAHLYKLTRAITEPAGTRLVDLGPVGEHAHWQFRAAF